MTNPSRSQAVWALVGQVSAVVALLGGLIGLFKFATQPKIGLSAELSLTEFHLPPDVIRQRELIAQLGAPEAIDSLLAPVAEEYPQHIDAIEAAKEKIIRYLLNASFKIQRDAGQFSGLWVASVTNDGNLPADEVVLSLPGARAVRLLRAEKLQEFPEGPVNLGTVRPGDSVTVIAWTFTTPGAWDVEHVFLSHANGLGKVRIRRIRTWPSVSTIALFTASPLLIYILVVIGIAIVRKNQRNSKSTQEVQTGDDRASGAPTEPPTAETPANTAPTADG
jgi:hypothetical protein